MSESPGKFPLPAQRWKICALKFPMCSRHLKLLFDRHLTRQYLLVDPLGPLARPVLDFYVTSEIRKHQLTNIDYTKLTKHLFFFRIL